MWAHLCIAVWNACVMPVVGACLICWVFRDFAESHRVATKKQMVSDSRVIAEFGDDQKLLGFGLFCFVRVELEEFREASGCNFPVSSKKGNLFCSFPS